MDRRKLTLPLSGKLSSFLKSTEMKKIVVTQDGSVNGCLTADGISPTGEISGLRIDPLYFSGKEGSQAVAKRKT
jgi:hypothetical protein